MFHMVNTVSALSDLRLCVQFAEGSTKIYDVKPLLKRWDTFKRFESEPELFAQVKVDIGGYGIVWDDELDRRNKALGIKRKHSAQGNLLRETG